MAQIDDLLGEVPSSELRRELAVEIGELRRRKSLGLVFERHLPEYAVVSGQKLHPGTAVVHRDEPETRYIVLGVKGTNATVKSNGTDEPRQIPVKGVLVVKGLGESIYPGLSRIEPLERAPGKPSHAVINGENFHASQLLDFLYRSKVDCIYIDPVQLGGY
jgi:adenine-specific DNA-methyltransferase